ncbi:monovalent cation/H+ antiporter complex subunit F [Candidatus Leptofilum sp.]|uniref:monovalent cation/H+ antiporter complex subunit F n=1 Tax=Candidatus Leptofilum sp. TaxID=3241576 RepID=UPI003B5BA289
MEQLLQTVLQGALFIHTVLLLFVVYKVWRGKEIMERLVGADIVATLTIGILILTALIQSNGIYVDVALGLAALGFVSTIALAKYAADEQMF